MSKTLWNLFYQDAKKFTPFIMSKPPWNFTSPNKKKFNISDNMPPRSKVCQQCDDCNFLPIVI